KWNGTSWDSVSLGLNGAVLALATRDSILYAAGNFSNAGGDTLADQVAKWDGSSWSALGSGFKGYNPPRTLAFFDDKLYTFRAADGTLLAEDFFGVWNDTTWEVAKNPSPFIQKLVSTADKLYICHTGGIITWDGSSFENVSPQLNGLINDVATSGNDLFVVGFAENIGNHPYGDNVAKWDGSSWSALGSGLNGSVETVAISGNEIYVGGTFTDAGGNPNADHIAKWNGSSWEALGTGLNNTVNEIVIRDGDVYVSGIFTDAGGNANADGIAKWNGTSWEAFGTGVNSTLYTEMAISGSNIYITGIFASAGNVSGADYVAKWNGSSWEAMPGLGVVNARAIAVLGEKVFLGGNFGLISEWNGSAWQTLSTGLNGTVNAFAVSGNDLYIGGAFTNAGGNSSADYLTKWNGASFEPVPGTLNASVKQLMVNGDDLYVYGNFLNAGNNLSADRLARFDGATWYSVGLLDGSEDFLALTMDGYDMVVGGSWTGIEGTIMPNIARWHHEIPQPTIQPTSLSFHNATVSSVQISFTAASGNPRGYLVLRKSGGAPTGSPVDETEYFPGQTLGDAVVAYNGSLTHFTDVTVTPGNVYHYAVFSYNGTGQATNYLTTNPLRSNTVIGIVSTAVAANTVSTQTATGSAYPSGFPDQAWRMFSVPVNLTDKSVSSILSDFGEPGNSTWRLFEGTMDASSTAQLQPGKAYWLKQIHIPGGKQVTLGAGMTASVSDATLVLTPGWNQISNPFAFPIDWNNNTDAGGNINIKGPIAFDGSKYIGLGQTKGDNTSFTTLNPFDGYYVYNAASTNQSLTIDPTGAYPKTIAKVTASYMDADWLIQVGVKNGKFEDQFNYIGAAQDAAYGEDRYDLPELPVIGEYVSVSFDHTSNDRTVPYTIDCHKNGLEGYTWDMSVRTNLEGENVLNWNPDRVPANFIVKIMNVSNREIVETQDYLFKSRTEDQPVRFKVWVGTVTYVENASNSFVDELPTSFALSQNYPNPFN
ncbi:MAG: hypothetical protein KDC45_11765, partial [Bacteroidetes bacterium]|nr:hypothetical protein [Bacteroidota bacterium]